MRIDSTKFNKVRMEVVEFTANSHKRGVRGTAPVDSGTKLFAIKYSKGGYFTYCYLNRDTAQNAINRMVAEGTDNEFYYPFNVVSDIQRTQHREIK